VRKGGEKGKTRMQSKLDFSKSRHEFPAAKAGDQEYARKFRQEKQKEAKGEKEKRSLEGKSARIELAGGKMKKKKLRA